MTPFGPGGTPRGGIRPWLAGVAALGAVGMVPLMFADRVPGMLDRISDSIENGFGDWYWSGIKPYFPRPDEAMHVLLFAGAALLVGMLCWSWRTFAVGQALVLAAGLGIEFLQPVFTSSRDIQEHDIVSNLIGQSIGVVVAVALWWAWSAWEARSIAH